jgi:hypothetical protein
MLSYLDFSHNRYLPVRSLPDLGVGPDPVASARILYLFSSDDLYLDPDSAMDLNLKLNT